MVTRNDWKPWATQEEFDMVLDDLEGHSIMERYNLGSTPMCRFTKAFLGKVVNRTLPIANANLKYFQVFEVIETEIRLAYGKYDSSINSQIQLAQQAFFLYGKDWTNLDLKL